MSRQKRVLLDCTVFLEVFEKCGLRVAVES